MNLIISLLGQKHHNLFNEKFIHNKKNNTNSFLLNEILKRFTFCKKIFIICNKKKNINPTIVFKKDKKIKIIYSSETTNQINSILKVNKFIKKNEKIIILNPDSFFDVNSKDFNNKSDGIIFNIHKNDIGRNFEKKDTLYLDNKSKIIKIKTKTKDLTNKIVSAGLYCFNRWEYFIEGCLEIKDINKKNLHVADVFSKLIKSKNFSTNTVKNFICFR